MVIFCAKKRIFILRYNEKGKNRLNFKNFGMFPFYIFYMKSYMFLIPVKLKK